MEQRTEEWFQARLGKITSSIVEKTRSGYNTKTYKDLVKEKVYEIVYQKPLPKKQFTSDAMAWGVETEDEARDYYRFVTGFDVKEAGLIIHPDYPDFGTSVDGLVLDSGVLEIKCPNTLTHMDSFFGEMQQEKEYKCQIQWHLFVTGREWCDFVSFDPRFSKDPFYCNRIYRDNELIQELCDRAIEVMAKARALIRQLPSQALEAQIKCYQPTGEIVDLNLRREEK